MLHEYIFTGNPEEVNIGCFLFSTSKKEILKGKIIPLQCASPIRRLVSCTNTIKKAESGQDWGTFMKQEIDQTETMEDEERRYNENNSEREQLIGGQTSQQRRLKIVFRKKCFVGFCMFVLLVVIVVIIIKYV